MRGEPVGDVKKEEMESNGFFGVLSDEARPEVSFGRSVEPVKVLNQELASTRSPGLTGFSITVLRKDGK